MREEYKGYLITYDEDDNVWNCDDLNISADSLKKAKGAIDRFIKKEMESKNIKAYYNEGYSDKYVAVVITSFLPESRYGRNEAWIKKLNGTGRRKVNVTALYEYSEKNKKIIDEMVGLEKERTALRNRIVSFEKKLDPFKEEKQNAVWLFLWKARRPS